MNVNHEVDFFGNTEWPGNSPDLNPCENVGAIVKMKVEEKMLAETGENRYSLVTLRKNLLEVLLELENDTGLFESLLSSFPDRLEAIRAANGGQTKF